MIILIWLLANAGVSFADKIPYVTIDQRPSVIFFNSGKNDVIGAETALMGGADAIVVTISDSNDLDIMKAYIEIALSIKWERVVGLGIELQQPELLPDVTQILLDRGYSGQAPVFIISSDFTVLAQSPFIPVADLTEIPLLNVTQLVDDLLNMRISVVIASKDQVQRFDPVAQQLEYQTELFLQLREANIVIDVCCFSNEPLAPEFNGELINEIRHFMKLGGINVLTRKPSIVYAVATEFLVPAGQSRTFNFAVIAELPKLQSSGGVTVDLGWKSLMNDLNVADVEFVIQLGIVEGIGQNCTEELKEFVSAEFDASIHPFMYSPGVDEWHNCDKTAPSSNQEIQKREDLVLDLFATGNMSLGQLKIPILRQSNLAAIAPEFQEFPQNILWEQNNMFFVYPSLTNVVSAPNLDSSNKEDTYLIQENGGSELEVTGGSTPTALDIQQPIEGPPTSQVQYEATVAWLELAFNEAIRRQSSGIVLAWHASDVFDYTKHGKGTVFAKFRLLLEKLLIKFKKPVLLLQIGATGFRVDKPLVSSVSGQHMEMLTRVSCASGQWVNVQVNPDATNFNNVFKVSTQFAQIESVLAPVKKTNSQTDSFQRTETTFSFAVLGGLPFNRPPPTWTNLLQDISQAGVSFVVHTGDIKAPNKNCSNDYFQFIAQTFSEVNHPLVYVPGDNEWANCNREDNGQWDPTERLDYIRELFFVETSQSLGKYPMPITSQASFRIIEAMEGLDTTSNHTNGEQSGLPENAIWSREGVVFSTLHMVGQNNNLAQRDYDTDEIYDDRLLDFSLRNEANKKFVDTIFDVAMRDDAEGIVIFFNGNPFNHSNTHSQNYANIVLNTGFFEVMELIQNQTLEFGQPVVLVHSDYQQFLIDQPFNMESTTNGSESQHVSSSLPRIENLTRVMLPGSGQVWWLEVAVNPSSAEVFSFIPRLVRTNLIDHTPITHIWSADDPDKVCLVESEEEVDYPGQ